MARKYRIFLSSPGDVEPERDIVEQVVRRINDRHGENGFDLYRWEHEHYTAAATFQDQIPQASECDVVVCIFWKRLGSELPDQYKRPDGTAPTGSEFEFEQAIDAATSSEDQLPDIYVYRSGAKVSFDADTLELETAQFNLLKAFWTRWFRNERGHFTGAYDSYDTLKQFQTKVERALEDWLTKRNTGVVWTMGSPFRGLQPFDFEHAPVFFGRRRETGRARARLMVLALAGQRFLLITGPSGSGKSSLVRAGVIPALAAPGAGDILPDQRVHVVTSPNQMDPGGTGWALGMARALFADAALAEALQQGDFATPDALAGLLQTGGASCAAPLRAALRRIGAGLSPQRSVGMVLLVDQLEELFSWPADSADGLCALLETLCVADPGADGVTVIATMRSEFRHRLPELPALGRLVRFDTVPGPDDPNPVLDVALPSAADFRDIIEGPAKAAGLVYEPATATVPALHERIEAQAQARALPALQYLLAVLYDQRDGDTLTHAAFDALGGVPGVMAAQGEQIIQRLGTDDLPAVVRALVKTGDPGAPATARRVPDRVLAAQKPLVQAFVDAGLIVSDGQTLRLAHESLIAGWDRLRKIVANERRLFESRERLADLSALYAQGEPVLLTGFLLNEGQDLLQSWGHDLLADAQENLPAFITASAKAARAKTRRKVAGWAGAALVAVGVAVSVAALQTQAQRDTAFQFAMAQSETASREESRSDALRHAIKAYDLRQTAQSRSLLMEKSLLLSSPGMLVSWDMDAAAIAFAADGTVIAARKSGGVVALTPETATVIGTSAPMRLRKMIVLPNGALVYIRSDNTVRFVPASQLNGGRVQPIELPSVNTVLRATDAFALGQTSFGFAAVTKADKRDHFSLLLCSGVQTPDCTLQEIPGKMDGATLNGDTLTVFARREIRRYTLTGQDLVRVQSAQGVQTWVMGADLPVSNQRSFAGNAQYAADARRPGLAVNITQKLPLSEFASVSSFQLDTGFLPERGLLPPALSLQPGQGTLLAFAARADLLGRYRIEEELKFAKLSVLRHPDLGLIRATHVSADGTRIAMRHLNGAVSIAAGLGFDPTDTPIARLSGQAGAATAFAALSPTQYFAGFAAPFGARSRPDDLSVAPEHAAMHPTGGLAVVRRDNAVALVDPETPSDLTNTPLPIAKAQRVAFTRDGQLVAAGPGHLATPTQVFNLNSRGVLGGLTADPTRPNAVYYTKSQGEISRWDIDTDTHDIVVPASITQDRTAGLSLSAHPSGRWIAATRSDRVIRVYDVTGATTDPITLDLDSADSKVVAFSPDGAHVAVLDSGGKLYLFAFDAAKGRAERVFALYPAPEPVPFATSDLRPAVWMDWMGDAHIGVATAHGDVLRLRVDAAAWRAQADQRLPRPVLESDPD